jgi:hypothetical protein
MNLPYLVPRVMRHFLPERLTRFLLLRAMVIKPGLETADARMAVDRYREVMSARGIAPRGKRVLVFGYGGRFDIGIRFLELGAKHVVLCDKYAPPDDGHNGALAQNHADYLFWDQGQARPRPEYMTLLQTDIVEATSVSPLPSSDIVVSSSVYEHLRDVEGVTRALAHMTSAGGLHVHFVDLRDHFFRYPFEMLHYSEQVWHTWLNPTSNHNRYRLWDYRRVFEASFRQVDIQVLQRDEIAFSRALGRIRPEFIGGNRQEDAATLITIVAAKPRR